MNPAEALGNGARRSFGGGALAGVDHLLEGRTLMTDWSDA